MKALVRFGNCAREFHRSSGLRNCPPRVLDPLARYATAPPVGGPLSFGTRSFRQPLMKLLLKWGALLTNANHFKTSLTRLAGSRISDFPESFFDFTLG